MGNVASLIGHLISLRIEQRTGILMVRSGDLGTSIFLRGGDIIFAEEDAHAETLGRSLVRQNKLTQAQYDSVIARMSGPDSGATGQLLFGELAIELGFLSTPLVVKALGDQVRFRVMRIFQRRDEELTWQFQPHMDSEMVFAPGTPGGALRAAVGSSPPSVEELVLDAVRWIDDDHKNELGLFMALGKKLGVHPEDRLAVVRRFVLSREETELLAKLDGKRSLGEVLSMSGSVDGPAVLTALLLTNVLGNVDRPARAASITLSGQPAVTAVTVATPPAVTPAVSVAPTPRPSLTSTAPTPMQVPAVMRPPNAAAMTPKAPPAVTRPAPALSTPATASAPTTTSTSAGSGAHTATTTPPKAAAPQDDVDDPGPQSVRAGWWGTRASGTQPAATTTAKPPAAKRTPTPQPPAMTGRPPPTTSPGFPSRGPIPSPPSPSRSFPIPAGASGSASRIPTAPPTSNSRIPAAPPSNPAPASGSQGRIPTAPPSNPAPQSARNSAVMKALDAQRTTGSQAGMPAASSPEARLVAEREFQTALAHFKSFRYADASPGFTRATEMMPQSAEYRLYARWNHILQKGAPMQVHERGEAWRLALAAIAADPNSAFAHYVAGAVAQEDGQKPIAHRYLSRAVALDPQLVDAQRRLRIVDRREA